MRWHSSWCGQQGNAPSGASARTPTSPARRRPPEACGGQPADSQGKRGCKCSIL